MNDRLYVKAVVLKQRETTLVIITVDAVAIAEIGTIRDTYLEEVRNELEDSLKDKIKQSIASSQYVNTKQQQRRTPIDGLKEVNKILSKENSRHNWSDR